MYRFNYKILFNTAWSQAKQYNICKGHKSRSQRAFIIVIIIIIITIVYYIIYILNLYKRMHGMKINFKIYCIKNDTVQCTVCNERSRTRQDMQQGMNTVQCNVHCTVLCMYAERIKTAVNGISFHFTLFFKP